MARINRARDRLLVSVDGPTYATPEPMRRPAPVAIDGEVDSPSPFVYLVWMVLLPTAVLTVLFTVLWAVA